MRTGRPKRLKLEERIELARRYHAGETPKVLAEAYGVSRRHVTRLAREEQGDGLAVRDPSESVSFRAAQSELSAFDEEWQTLGFANRSQALQALVRARCGVLDVMRKDVNTFAEALLCAQDLAQAGRVLAKAVQRGKLSLEEEDRATLLSLLDLAQETRREMAALHAAARARRGDGWQVPEIGPVGECTDLGKEVAVGHV
ncbi:helix-turn-helix domain-containing protein [Roseovarius sp. CAU 1744]|uniref:helix-turn-helix domain-containing protein n=1 Tax=Roseovarius sp. CAU 1744 TaxID=3140368 RepID=UPI00325B0284